MKPSEDVIVTVTLGREQFDMELPSFLPIRDVKEKMCEILLNDKCLASCGIWDGSVIACVNGLEVKNP